MNDLAGRGHTAGPGQGPAGRAATGETGSHPGGGWGACPRSVA